MIDERKAIDQVLKNMLTIMARGKQVKEEIEKEREEEEKLPQPIPLTSVRPRS